MSLTCSCADGHHSKCMGKVAKWHASRDDVVLERPLMESDGVRTAVVACQCACHLHPAGKRLADSIEIERLTPVREYAS